MIEPPDLLSAALRALAFIAMTQVAGSWIYLKAFGSALDASKTPIRRAAGRWTAAGLIALPMQFALEPARMAGQFHGMADPVLVQLAMSSPGAVVVAARITGLLLVASALRLHGRRGILPGLAGFAMLAASFGATGHTMASPERWLLVPAIMLHAAVVCFWFGSLLPLMHTARLEPAAAVSRVVERFSRIAIVIVPLIAASGLVVAIMLLPEVASLGGTYGLGLVGKLCAFAVLMALAALNRWRLGPALATGEAAATLRFIRSVRVERWIIGLVLAGTAALTMFTSPQ